MAKTKKNPVAENAIFVIAVVLLLSGTLSMSDSSSDDTAGADTCTDGIDNDGDGVSDSNDAECDPNAPMYSGEEGTYNDNNPPPLPPGEEEEPLP